MPFRRLVSGLCVAVVLCAPSGLSAANAANAPTPGTPLPQLTQQRPTAGIVAASSAWLLIAGGKDYDENDPTVRFNVVRRSDGVTVRSFDAPQPADPLQRYQISGDDLVKPVVVDNTHSHVDISDVATGLPIRTINTDGPYVLIHAEPTWALIGTSLGLGFVHADGSTTLAQGAYPNGASWVGGDSATAYVTSQDGDFAYDAATGARTTLPFSAGAKLFAVTPTTLIGSVQGFPGGVQTQLFRALDRTTLQPAWSVDVPTDYHEDAFVALGGGVAAIYHPDAPDPVYEHLQLRPVDLATGSLQTAVATDVYYYVVLPDQKVGLVFADTPGGRLSIADGSAVVPFGDLPDQHDQSLDLGLSGSTVAASWQERAGVWTTTYDGLGSWSQTDPAATFAPGDSDKRIWSGGNVVMTESTSNNVNTFHLQWPTGSRTFTADSALLSHGGTYVERMSNSPGAGSTTVENAISGAVVATYTNASPRPIDGTEIWSGPTSGFLIGTDLTGATATRAVFAPPGCTTILNTYFRDVHSHWATLTCGSGTTVIVDLSQTAASFTAPAAQATFLGTGYYVSVRAASPGDALEATVTSLTTGESRVYGPVRGAIYQPGIALATNDDGTPNFVYADPTYQVRKVDVSWVTGPPPTPAMQSSAPPTISGTAQVGVELSALPGTWTPGDGTYTYSWMAAGTPVSSGSSATYTPTAADLGKTISVEVTASKTGYTSANATSSATSAVLPGAFVAGQTPTISGGAQVGAQLLALPGTWTPSDGTYTYTWMAAGTLVSSGSSATYTPTADDLGKAISVEVTASRTGYTSANATSSETSAVLPGTFVAGQPPTISGTPRFGVPITASPGSTSPAGTDTYQWLSAGTLIAGATSATYIPTAAVLGQHLSVRVTATRAGYNALATTSVQTAAVLAGLIANRTRPTVYGTVRTGHIVNASPGSWTPGNLVFRYQWLRDGRVISGATGRSYKLPRSARTHRFSVRVTAMRADYTTASRTSVQTMRVG